MDPASLYREEVFTDRKIGTIRVLTPVTSTGAPDGTRAVLYSGETQLLTPGGVLPLVFELDAGSLAEAVERFAAGASEALERTRRTNVTYVVKHVFASSGWIAATGRLIDPDAPGRKNVEFADIFTVTHSGLLLEQSTYYFAPPIP